MNIALWIVQGLLADITTFPNPELFRDFNLPLELKA